MPQNRLRPFQRYGLASTVLAGILVISSSLISCSTNKYSGPVETVTFGALPTGSATLIYIAQEQGFFADNGLNVNVTDYATGVATTDALLKGEIDIAWSAELPLVRKALAKAPISIIASLSRFNDEFLYGLKSHNIENIADLKGKKIGLPRNTIAEFYLARLLTLNGMSMQDVSLFDVPPAQSMNAITSDNFDAVVTWEPVSTQIKTQLADKVVAWSVQSSQPGYGIITCRNDWISEHPQVVSRFLKSLVQAEDYLRRNPEACRTIVQKRVNFDDALMNIVWKANEYSISLDQSLITAMEDEARWLINSNLTAEKQVPNFLDYAKEDALKAVKPGVVNIIR
ncbi:MAG: NrtA/SsuA/CpmA family ABC transporter substrate-binding protein [Chloroflexota bacterium]